MAKQEWRTYTGAKVPDEAVSPFDKRKERVIQSLYKKAVKLSKELEKLKELMYEKGDELYEEKYRNRGLDIDKKRGNYTHFSYDKSIKFEMNVQENISFSDDINLSQQKLNEYIEDVLSGANTDIQQLVNNAFKTRKGRLDKARIFSLFALKIEHPKWQEAMELIKGSIETNDSRRYASISVRDDNGDYNAVQLNISSL
jgi:hypothetical protein